MTKYSQIADQKKSKFLTPLWVACALLSMLGHPLAQVLGYVSALDMGLYTKTEVNEGFVSTPYLVFVCVLFGLLRFLVFWFFTRSYQDLQTIVVGFAKANLVGLFGIPLFIILTQELEGNVVGFLIALMALGSIMTLGVWLFRRSVREIKILRSPNSYVENDKEEVTTWNQDNPPTSAPGKMPSIEERLGQYRYKLLQWIGYAVLVLLVLTFLS